MKRPQLRSLKDPSPFDLAVFLTLFSLVLFNIQRFVYLGWILAIDKSFPSGVGPALLKGLAFDLSTVFYLFAFFFTVLLLLPAKWLQRKGGRALILAAALPALYLATTFAVSELFFFEEFKARFNFIAVDYLVYTHEVIRNIVESYTLPVVILTFCSPLVIWWALLRRKVARLEFRDTAWRPRLAVLTMIVATAAAFTHEDSLLSKDAYWPREVSKNSLFALFSAYNRNSINFTDFYTSMDHSAAVKTTEDWLGGPTERTIQAKGEEKHWNVVMVAMESMSASFLNHFGETRGLTPNLDRLMDEGASFTKLYATGTRTVRGLEALMLSLPPTPGQSILRRPNSDHLFNLGTVFRQHDYKTQFVYGGHAVFDNMAEWFQGNGFAVVDRSDFPSQEIQFSNAWGVCDEDLFAQALKQQEKMVASGKPFFQLILTTSNHRPYTFPEGRIDIPSRTGREGAIKYSDYSIGQFITWAKTKPWFDNTLFIFIADHDAAVAGGTDIPVRDYLIPAIFYNPKLVQPRKFEMLATQIDIAPTLLGLLNFSYQSKFFGQDLNLHPGGRALLGTYQKIALLEPGTLTILAPNRSVEIQQLDEKFNVIKTTVVTSADGLGLPEFAKRAVAIYQTASDLFARGLLKHADDSAKPN